MCGICGEWDPSGASRERVARMSATLAHRGPDDRGLEVFGEVALATRRLSVIDLETGHQPLADPSGRYCIAFNGEIYNYRALRRALAEKGYGFRTRSDTEVVLNLYREFGPGVVDHLRGMFAFAIWDGVDRTLFLARDRFGQKPLFYMWDGRRFVFASEIKAILSSLDRLPAMNLSALDDYLSVRFIPNPETMYQGVRKLGPGHRLLLDAEHADRRPDPESYWSLAFLPKLSITEAEAVLETRRLVQDAVESHMVSDVDVGAFLSGGMDSSLVVALMARSSAEPVPTFAVGVTRGRFNELPFAAQVAAHCGTDHHEQVVWPDLIELLPTMVYQMEEPSDPVAACMVHAAALAAPHLKVVLTGDGGDELFAGFDRYSGISRMRAYAALPEPVRRLVLGPLVYALPDRAGYKTLAHKARWVHRLSFHDGARRYAEATLFFRFGPDEKSGLYTDETRERLVGRDATDSIVAGFEAARADTDLDRMLYTDMVTRLPEHSLMLTDRMTMLHGLEARPPFLDTQLAEFVARLPVDLKVKRGRLKHLLREVARPYLPESILRRPKQGFMFPLGHWMKGPLVPVLRAFIERSALVEDGVFRREPMVRMLDEHLADRADHHTRLWMLLNVEVWYRLYRSGWNHGAVEGLMDELIGPARRASSDRRP
jgi:asparagine synthase (glutamine-hydrolysing)